MKKIIMAMAIVLAATGLKAKTLIAYYSFTNNSKTIATELQAQTGADIVSIEPAEKGIDYAANNYSAGSSLIAAIRANPNDAASYPAIDAIDVDLADYDMIVIAVPLWWSNMAAPMQTFLFQYGAQMEGKHIALIVSSASSGISSVVADAKRLIPDGIFVEPNLWIRSSQTRNCGTLIEQWLNEINYKSLTDGITPSRANDNHEVALYSLSGVRVDQATLPGIYIRKTREGSTKFTVKAH